MKPKTVNRARVLFPSYSTNESAARAMASAFIAQTDPTFSELADIKCAVSEAVTNCIVHAYKGKIGMIFMDVKIRADRSVEIEIRDKGCGIPDVQLAMQPLYTTDAENERSGMGFAVMQSFMDTLRVASKVGKGTKVVMTKNLSPLAGHVSK